MQTNNLLRFQLDKYELLTGEDILPKEGLLENAATIARCEYSPLGSELKWCQDGVKTENGVKTEDGKIIDKVHHKYVVDENEDLIKNIFRMDYKIKITISQRYRKSIMRRYLKENHIDVFENLFDFKKSIKILADIDEKINMIRESYDPKAKVGEKVVVTIFNKIRYSMIEFYLDHNTIIDLRNNINVIKQIVC